MNHRRILRSAAVGIIIAAVVLAVTFIRRDRPPARVAIQVLKSETIDVGGEQRSYQLIVPQSRSGERIPLVIAFHGMGETAESMAEYARLDQLAAQQNVLVAIPEMSHGTWVIRDPGSMSAQNPDVQLFDAHRCRRRPLRFSAEGSARHDT